MSLMGKFSAVEIKADNRISSDDRDFCICHQEAFDKSGPALQKLADMMEAIKAEQWSILSKVEDHCSMPYVACKGFSCDEGSVYSAVKDRNHTFINTIVRYFSQKYKVELDVEEIKAHLIPAAPKEPELPWGGYRQMSDEEIDAFKEKLAAHEAVKKEYQKSLYTLPLRYEQIVDEIFVQLGGFSFEEQSMNEFLERTWNCCHNRYTSDSERFEIKNDTLRLTGYWISVDENKWMTHPVPQYRPNADMKTLLNAVAYYECGRMDEGHAWFPELFKYDTKENQFDTTYMSKIKGVKMFKNGRVDIKFRSAAYVQEFVELYLRRKSA